MWHGKTWLVIKYSLFAMYEEFHVRALVTVASRLVTEGQGYAGDLSFQWVVRDGVHLGIVVAIVARI